MMSLRGSWVSLKSFMVTCAAPGLASMAPSEPPWLQSKPLQLGCPRVSFWFQGELPLLQGYPLWLVDEPLLRYGEPWLLCGESSQL
jgi:hypothetical protein